MRKEGLYRYRFRKIVKLVEWVQNLKRFIDMQFVFSQEIVDELGYEDMIMWLKYFQILVIKDFFWLCYDIYCLLQILFYMFIE